MAANVRYNALEADEENGMFTNRTTMMANLEEWIKMATDNKINSRNSWNFALIDYFYDLNVLRDSENNINFQKASATLDGCVKIYSSRVDSVTSETGKLLSGLAQRREAQKKQNQEDNGKEGAKNEDSNSNSQDKEANDDSVEIDPLTGLPIGKDVDAHTRTRVHNRILETTLVEFDTIKLKELDQELSIDPLFKRALVDFDEGGARSFLLNTLNIDKTARVVFDASVRDSARTKEDEKELQEDLNIDETKLSDIESDKESDLPNIQSSKIPNESLSKIEETSINGFSLEDEILALGMDMVKFQEISTCEISPSIQQLRNVVEDINKAKSFIDSVNNKFDNFLTEAELQEAMPENNLNEYDGVADEFDTGIRQELEYSLHQNQDDDDDALDNDDGTVSKSLAANPDDTDQFSTSAADGLFEKDLIAYFDDNFSKNWRGREHWKVRNFKKRNLTEEANFKNTESKTDNSSESTTDLTQVTKHDAQHSKKKKTGLEIDFFNLDDNLEANVFATSKKPSQIEMPQRLRTNDLHYLLPDDFHFSADKITTLFIKPRQKMSLFKNRKRRYKNTIDSHANMLNGVHTSEADGNLEVNKGLPEIADEQFWADNYERKEQENNDTNDEDVNIREAEISNPFDDGIDFNQAFDDASFPNDDNAELNENSGAVPNEEDNKKFHLADNKVNYSRVAKKVDVRRLKNNLWKSINLLVEKNKENFHGPENEQDGVVKPLNNVIELKFTDITNEIKNIYSKETLRDISTSFCFICLLHLANEYGLQISNADDYENLVVEYYINETTS
ncbi:hypothetical protein KAFR_0G01140 [Kazachstania africana CBS 2517]|uniref:Condensin complex subunit 2 n=1 Tax=Kazachstania africana (strain ATCC 22294 / BCRC 22015 / CBS 2517 / CECT 1963 / NBRC 1671 / NRRL Y-8276) TaxID=1071382 RepID=H2AXP7_KAZAF|nr:hypothetical protein KAFR_0G01140 [Kazachstania africana CBS 2517]CCF59147.1 hypothetical protein KAFR_0G01140 [Kazachstania africana CBS 2517]